ncbi:hypothetical protein [Streptomyces coelicoflavus]
MSLSVDLIAAAAGVHPSGIDDRLDHIEAAALRARRIGAHVLVW